MACRTRTKMAALIVLGVISGTTSHFIGRKMTRAAPVTKHAPVDESGRVVGGSIAKNTMRRISANYTAEGLTLKAKASVTDTRPGSQYSWAIRIIDINRNVIFSECVIHNKFDVPSDQSVSPEFDELVPLPLKPGIYRAEVFIFRVPPGFNESQLGINDKDFAETFLRDMTGSMGGAKFLVQ